MTPSTKRWASVGSVAGLVLAVLLLGSGRGGDPGPAISSPTPPPSTGSPVPSSEAGAPTASPSTSEAAASSAPVDPLLAGFGIGQKALGIRLPTVGGTTFDLGALAGHPVWIEFTASWCPSCRDDARVMRSFAERYRSAGLVVVAIDVREDRATATAFSLGFGPGIVMAIDSDGTAAAAWRVTAFPSRLFIDADGIVRDAGIGSAEPPAIATSLATILPGVSITP